LHVKEHQVLSLYSRVDGPERHGIEQLYGVTLSVDYLVVEIIALFSRFLLLLFLDLKKSLSILLQDFLFNLIFDKFFRKRKVLDVLGDLLLDLLVVLLESRLHLVEVNLNRGALLAHIVLNHVVSRLHVDPSALLPSGQEVDGALEEPDLLYDVDDIEFSMEFLHALALDALVVRRLVADLA